MRILLIGGTRFVGKAIAVEAMRRGHEVTVFHRGNTHLDGAQHILGDRDVDLSALIDGQWDATVDVCAYRPGQVEALLAALGDRAGRFCLISTVSVYDESIPAGSSESAALADTGAVESDPAGVPLTGESYGPLKVLCERSALAGQPDALIIRPTYVIGPDDHTMRFPTWVRRIAAGGKVECPGPAGNAMQYVDARDQAAFVIDLLEQGRAGTFHCAAEATTFGEMLEAIATALDADAQLDWLDPAQATGRETDFPLWSGEHSTTMLQMNPSAAFAAGLRTRDLGDTVRDTAQWLRRTDLPAR